MLEGVASTVLITIKRNKKGEYMTGKTRVAVLFGGRSAEHEVSVISARSMLAAMDRERYEPVMVGIAKDGRWWIAEGGAPLEESDQVLGDGALPVHLDYLGSRELVAGDIKRWGVDVVFPLLHGPYGEDGAMQGLLELADVPYVGAGVVGSAVGMDKEMMKRAFSAEGLPQLDYTVVRCSHWRRDSEGVLDELCARFSWPVFVKPASLGSSVGVSRAEDRRQLRDSIAEAARYDYKVVIEEAAIDCREVEVAILGNEEVEASTVGEIEVGSAFYDYGAKYVDNNSSLHIPARIEPNLAEEVRQMGIRAFRAVEAWGLSRVDFFVGKSGGQMYINEINTMPGFTPVSMYPKLWEASGLAYGALIDRLIELALERHEDQKGIKTSL